MAGDAAHRVGVVVVHLAAQHALAPRAALGRRDHLGDRLEAARAQQGQIDERRRAQAERPEDPLVAEAVEREAAHLLDRGAEQHEAEIAVERARAGGRLRLLALDRLVDVLLGAAAGDEVDAALALDLARCRGSTAARPAGRSVCASRWRKVTCVFPCTPKLWKKRVTRSSRPMLRSRTQQHHRGRGGERLGQRGDVEDRVLAHRRARRRPRACADQRRAGTRRVRRRSRARPRPERRRARPPRPSPARPRRSSRRRAPPRSRRRRRREPAGRARAAGSPRDGRRESRRPPGTARSAKKSRKTAAATSSGAGAVAVGERAEHDAGDALELPGEPELREHAIDAIRAARRRPRGTAPRRRSRRRTACRAARPATTGSRRRAGPSRRPRTTTSAIGSRQAASARPAASRRRAAARSRQSLGEIGRDHRSVQRDDAAALDQPAEERRHVAVADDELRMRARRAPDRGAAGAASCRSRRARTSRRRPRDHAAWR